MQELNKKNKDITGFIFINATKILFFFLIVILFLLLGKIIVEGSSVISLEFLFDEPRNNMTEGGIWPAIFGTLAVTFIMVLFAVPLGVCAAIYLNEYAPKNFRSTIKPMLEILAAYNYFETNQFIAFDLKVRLPLYVIF